MIFHFLRERGGGSGEGMKSEKIQYMNDTVRIKEIKTNIK